MSLALEKLRQLATENKTASVAYSGNGEKYFSPFFKNSTKILSVSSEHAVLVKAVHNNDFDIYRVDTLLEDGEQVDPIALKTLSDYSVKTGKKVTYIAFDKENNTVFETDDVSTVFGFYKAPESDVYIGDMLSEREYSPSVAEVGRVDEPETVLKEYAKKGLKRGFPNYEGASAYGASVITSSGRIHFGGQFSCLEGRLGVHAETAVAINAFSQGDTDIEYIGLVSEKYRNTPVPMCGCCREFWNEISHKHNIAPQVYSFALDTNEVTVRDLKELLPLSWKNK